MSNSRPPAYQRLAELLIGSRIAMALRVVAERQIADLLATGPQTAEALSSVTGSPRQYPAPPHAWTRVDWSLRGDV